MSTKDFQDTGTQLYSQFIYKSRYARWLEDEGRREDWLETVDRYVEFFAAKFPHLAEEIRPLGNAIVDCGVMPSMRSLMTAGPALEKSEVAGYNCSYLPIDHPRSFDELFYILLNGTGVGFSVERQYVNKLPEIPEILYDTDTTIVVADSKLGWARSLKELISLLYSGHIPTWDLSKVRPAGARLKTFGGRASGPGPIDELFRFTVSLFKKASGRKLSSLECHDLACKIAEVTVVGGVRRSALLSLSNPSDDRMRAAKSGQWWQTDVHRAMANNSACYTEKPDFSSFLSEWQSLYESKSGERGFFSRVAAQNQVKKSGRRDPAFEWGCNPCSEIILRPYGFCNLSEVVVRSSDTLEQLADKVRVATILGTLQATLTDFKYLRPIWKKNAEEEALLGVSLTGIEDHSGMNNPDDTELPSKLEFLKNVAIQTNKEWAAKLGINPAAAITTVKPSGTVSQLCNTSSGIHPRFAPFYIRRVRADIKDPLAQFMKEKGFTCEEDVTNKSNLIFSFPIKSPEGSVVVKNVGAMHQLKLWKIYQDYWCEHKPSITVYYTDNEFLEIGNWLWKNFNEVSGISFLPHSEHTYRQAPYEEISENKYHELVANIPSDIDWSDLGLFEKEDTTTGTQQLACASGVCEVVDLVKG